MRKVALAAAVICCIVSSSLVAQMKQQPKPATPKTGKTPLAVAGARNAATPTFSRISIDDALKLYKAGKAVFIDVRSNEQFSYGHIKGALSIPGSQLIKRYAEVTPGKTVITYCACSAEQSSGRAVVELNAHGVKNTAALVGGLQGWEKAGRPTAKSR